MPRHPLSDIRAKIQRSKETLHLLADSTEVFIKDSVQKIEERVGFINDPLVYEIQMKTSAETPPSISILAGEIVHHLRSSLDHLVVKLSTKEGNNKIERLHFPICSSIDFFEKEIAKGRLMKVPNGAIEIIKNIQPFNTENHENSTLWILGKLSNIDKHRNINATLYAARLRENIEIGTSLQEGEPCIITDITGSGHANLTNEFSTIFCFHLEKPVPDFFVKCGIDYGISFELDAQHPSLPFLQTLSTMVKYTEKTINTFEEFL